MAIKILHIAPFFHGGVGLVCLNLTKTFIKMGHDVVLATPTEIPSELREYTKHYYILRAPSLKDPFYSIQFYLYNREKIKEITRLEKPDIIITHGPLVLSTRHIPDIPIISVIHGTYANELKWMLNHPIFGFERIRYIMSISSTYRLDMVIYKYATKFDNIYLVAVSKNTKRELVETGIRDNKIFPILNGVDKEKFKPMNKDYARTIIEDLFKIKLKDTVLLHVNPGPIKGTHILIKALALLKEKYGGDFTLLIIGKLGPSTYREHVEKLIRVLGLEGNVVLAGYVDNGKLPIFYNAADLTIVPSYSEGGPLIIPESLACGTPVIATNVGGNPEYLEMTKLTDLIVYVRRYDFSLELAKKLFEALTREKHVDTSSVPSWNEVALKYLEYAREIIKNSHG